MSPPTPLCTNSTQHFNRHQERPIIYASSSLKNITRNRENSLYAIRNYNHPLYAIKNGAIPSLPLIFIVHPLYSILLISTDTDVGRRCWPTRQREGGMFFICVYPFPPFWWRTRPALNLSRAPCGKREHLPATHAPLRPSLLSTRIECGRGHLGGWIWMWHPNYLHSYPLKTPIWISVFVFDFNINVIWMYLNSIF